MTRDEAIQVLQDKIDNRPLFKDEREAFEIAIEALQDDAEQKSDAYKRGFEDAKRAYEIELARPADAVQGVGKYENAIQKLREMPRYLNGVKDKQITKVQADANRCSLGERR